MTKLVDLKQRLLENLEIRKEYARADAEFSLIVTCHGLFPPSVTRVRPNERTDEDEEGTTDRGTDYRYPSGA